MTLLDNHLEQIQLSSNAIAELPFPAPKIFTNALLHSHDITSLIRDTESHERALFSLDQLDADPTVLRRSTIRPSKGTSETLLDSFGQNRHPRYGSAAAAILRGNLEDQLRKEGGKGSRERGEVDVEVLLKGAEKLCAIYPIPGALDKVTLLRARHGQLTSSINRFEARVAKQTGQLAQMTRVKTSNGDYDDDDEELDNPARPQSILDQPQITAEDLSREEGELRELEKKKRALEDRVTGMDRDLGGLLR